MKKKTLKITKNEELLAEKLNLAIHRMSKIHPSYNHSTRDIEGNRCWNFVPHEGSAVAKYLIAIKKAEKRQLNFLDLGCGIGNMLILANILGYKSIGVEYNEELVKIARRIYSSHIIQYNILNIENFLEYDVIYMYRPIDDEKVLKKLMQKIITKAKIGTYFIFMSCDHSFMLSKKENLRLIKVNIRYDGMYGLFQKIK